MAKIFLPFQINATDINTMFIERNEAFDSLTKIILNIEVISYLDI